MQESTTKTWTMHRRLLMHLRTVMRRRAAPGLPCPSACDALLAKNRSSEASPPSPLRRLQRRLGHHSRRREGTADMRAHASGARTRTDTVTRRAGARTRTRTNAQARSPTLVCAHPRMYARTHARSTDMHAGIYPPTRALMHARMLAHARAHACAHMYAPTNAHTRKHPHLYALTHPRTHVRTHAQAQKLMIGVCPHGIILRSPPGSPL